MHRFLRTVTNPGERLWRQAEALLHRCLARGFNPDIAWVLDLGRSRQNTELSILEVGPFSVCGLYAADTDILVQEVSRMVQK